MLRKSEYRPYSLPPIVNYRMAALIEPLAVVLQALSRSHLVPGQSVLILGAGAVGLLACAAAKALGASFVAAVDIDSDRLAFGKRNGWIDSTYCLPASTAAPASHASRKEEDAAAMGALRSQAQQVLAHFTTSFPALEAEGGFDAVYECTGVPSCINLSIFSCKTGGKVTLIGMGNPIVTLALGAAALREVDVIGVFRYAIMFPKAIKLLSADASRATGSGVQAHEINAGLKSATLPTFPALGGIENLISHQYPLEQAVEAFATLRSGRSPDGRGVVKVFIIDEVQEG